MTTDPRRSRSVRTDPMTIEPMKIDMVSEHASPLARPGGPDSGGQNVHVHALSGALSAQGHEVTVWTRRDAAELPATVVTESGVRVRHLDVGPARAVGKDELVPYIPELADALVAAWGHDRPDVVHAHFWMSGLAALRAARVFGLPTVQTFHALGTVKRRHHRSADTSPDGRIAAERCVARGVDRVVATCSDEVFELTRMGAPRHRIGMVPCGVDTDMFSPDGDRVPPGRARHRLVTVGRLVRRKGVDETIEALRHVPDTELVVAGGTGADDPDAARLAAVAREHGVSDRVRFVGPVARADVPALLRSADAVVCVPWYEPFGIVPLEAMACGRPVVASAVGGLTDTVVDGVTGVLVPPRRPRELAAALRGLLASPTAAAFGIAGRDRAVARYRWDRIAGATGAVYAQVLSAVADPQLARAVR